MCRFIETINVKDGRILHLPDHQDRMDRTIHHFFGPRNTPRLTSLLAVPEHALMGWYKCRVLYGSKIEDITWSLYQVRIPSSLSLIHANEINYNWKYADRKIFSDLIRNARTDDVIIVKNGFITDSSYANLLFRLGDQWITPSTPLLAGTQRKRLIQTGMVNEEPIHINDLHLFNRIKIINAMLDMETGPEWSMDIIKNL